MPNSLLTPNIQITNEPIVGKLHSAGNVDLFKIKKNDNTYIIQPLLAPQLFNKDTFWNIRKILITKYKLNDNLNIATEIQKTCYAKHGIEPTYFNLNKLFSIGTFSNFVIIFTELKCKFEKDIVRFKRYLSKIPTNPLDIKYSHIKLFAAIYFIEYYLINEFIKANPKNQPVVFDIGTGHGEFPYLLSKSLNHPINIVGTEINLDRILSSLFEYIKEKNEKSPDNIKFVEHDITYGTNIKPEKYHAMVNGRNIIKKPLRNLVDEYSKEDNEKILVSNHVFEHLNIETGELLVILLDTFDYIIISLPIEKRLNTSSGHKRLYNDKYFKKISKTIMVSYPDAEINYDFIKLGVYAIRKAPTRGA